MRLLPAAAMALVLALPAGARKHTDITEILAHMNAESKIVKTVSAKLDYTTVTVLVDDKSTQSGEVFFRKGKMPEICVNFRTPERKILLLKGRKGYIYQPKINLIQDFDVGQKSDLVQQFLLLGFGSDTNELKKVYNMNYLQEVELGGESTVQLELTPLKKGVASQITKIQLWVSEDSWLPVQQQFFEASGDYLVAHYTEVKVKQDLPDSDFELNVPSNVKRVPMN